MTARHFPSRTWWHYEFRFFSHFYAGKIMSPTWPYQQQDCENAFKIFDFMFVVINFNITKFCGKYHHHTSTEEVAEKQHSSFKSRYSSMIFTRFLSCVVVVCLEMAHMWHKCAKGATNIFEQMKMCCLLSKDKFCMM